MNPSTLARLWCRTANFWDRLFSRRVCPARPSRPAQRRLLLEALEVREVLSAPVAYNDAYTVPGSALTATASIGVLANDASNGNGTLSASLVNGAAHGMLMLNADGSFSYTGYAGYSGPDSFTYRDMAGMLSSNTATVTLNVMGSPGPVAINDAYFVSNGTLTTTPVAGVLANDSSNGNGILSASLINSTMHGMLMFNADGSFSYSGYAGYSGADSFTYRDYAGMQSSNTATVTLNVTAMPGPVANNDLYSVSNGTLTTTAAGGVLANDSSNGNGNLSASLVNGAAHGMLMLNADGSFSYTGYAGYSGPDSFTYRDMAGMLSSNTATVTLNVMGSPGPVAINDAYFVTNGSLTTTAANGVLANDSSNGNGGLFATAATYPSHGMLSLNSDGSFSYTGYAGYSGADSFTYSDYAGMQSSNTATVSLTVTGLPGPVANNDSYSVTNGALTTSAANGVLANDASNGNGGLSATALTYPSHGMLSLNTDGSFSYTGYAGYSGADSFTYRDTAGMQASNTATVSLYVIAPPVANNDSFSVPGGSLTTTAANGVLANDSSGGAGTLSAILVSGTTHGTLTLNPDGSFSYAGAQGYSGPDGFMYDDKAGGQTSNTATVSFNVIAAPVFDAARYTFSLPEDSAAGDPVGSVSATGPGALTYGIAAGNDGAFQIDGTTGNITVADPSKLNYLTKQQYALTVNVSNGGPAVAVAVTVNVTPASGIVTHEDVYTVVAGKTLTVSADKGLLINDYSLRGNPLCAEAASPVPGSDLTILFDGSFTYTPPADFVGTEEFTYTVTDGLRNAEGSLTIKVVAPVIVPTKDTYYIADTATSLSVLDPNIGVVANDPLYNGAPLKAMLDSQPVGRDGQPVQDGDFSLSADGTFTFTPKAGWAGYATFDYHLTDGCGLETAPTTVTIVRQSNRLGSSADAVPGPETTPMGGVALVGGGDLPAEAMDFMISQANHGDFVILTASSVTAGPKSYLDKFWVAAGGATNGTTTGFERLHSVQEIAITSAGDAMNLAYAAAVSNAEGIFITGGDQSNYCNFWTSGLIRVSVDQALNRGAVIGGTSAGLAVLGQVAYTATVDPPGGGNLMSLQALRDPQTPAVGGSLEKDFLDVPLLQNTVTETHVQPDDKDPQGRMGRLIAFMADMAAGSPGVDGPVRGIAVSKNTTVLVDANGDASVVGIDKPGLVNAAYFLSAPAAAPVNAGAGQAGPLSWAGVKVAKVSKGGTFNLSNWTGGDKNYVLDVNNGNLSVEGNDDIY